MKNPDQESLFNIFDIFNLCCSNFLEIVAIKGNFCITLIGTDGTYRGYSQTFGQATAPSALIPILYNCSTLIDCGTPLPCNTYKLVVHTLMWDANGHFIIKIGITGDEKYMNSDIIIVDEHSGVWNPTEKYYEFTNKNFADELITRTSKCFYIKEG